MEKTYIKKRIGIQPGTCATDECARKLDCDCKRLAKEVYQDLKTKYSDLTFQTKLTHAQIPGGIGACQPDGGLWFKGDRLVAVFEAKKQGAGGNAIERWFKNNYICRLISPFVSYVTFATGPGACANGVIPKTLNVAHSEGVDRLNFGGNSLLLSVVGFTNDELKAIMIETLEEALNP
jgi:hypothetical protein